MRSILIETKLKQENLTEHIYICIYNIVHTVRVAKPARITRSIRVEGEQEEEEEWRALKKRDEREQEWKSQGYFRERQKHSPKWNSSLHNPEAFMDDVLWINQWISLEKLPTFWENPRESGQVRGVWKIGHLGYYIGYTKMSHRLFLVNPIYVYFQN